MIIWKAYNQEIEWWKECFILWVLLLYIEQKNNEWVFLGKVWCVDAKTSKKTHEVSNNTWIEEKMIRRRSLDFIILDLHCICVFKFNAILIKQLDDQIIHAFMEKTGAKNTIKYFTSFYNWKMYILWLFFELFLMYFISQRII